ncbi:hypothetical protein GCM10020000_62860 [Streptomyces olivoverticillatus]
MAVGRVMRIGRSLDNELVVSDLQVSRHHAEFRATSDGRFEIVDLGSHNGTYVNGQPVRQQIIGPNDIVGVGHSTFRLVGDRLEEFVDTGDVSFSARHLTVTVDGGKQILKDVSFGVPEKSLIAVIGPSGSGKSTLLKALTGYRPANQGDVLYDNRNLYKQFAELRQRIGLVPQDDILHKELTVRKALRYAAKLRFPGDTAVSEREARIEEVLRELKLDIHKDKKVTALSGGQRKRVSVALELLTKPSLIFLDEPTSGLDPGMDRDVMQLLRGLADDGRTVLVVTHSVAELALCDKLLVMAPGGSVAYFGPPEEALNFFGYETWADVFSAFENYRDYDWAGRWKGSQHYQMYAADIDAVAPQSVHVQPQMVHPPKAQSWGSQLWTLVRRYCSVIASDRGFIALMLLLPAVLGGVSCVIPSDYGLAPPAPHHFNQDAGTIMLILSVGACFAGAANSVRELIKERVIYERERAVGLSRSAYLMSKVIVLGVITAVQGVLITAIGFSVRKLPEHGVVIKNLLSRRALPGDHRPRLHLDDDRPRDLLAGQDRREDDAAAGDVRDRPGRLHRHHVQDLRLAGCRAGRLADALTLGHRRRGSLAEPLAHHGPDGQEQPQQPRPALVAHRSASGRSTWSSSFSSAPPAASWSPGCCAATSRRSCASNRPVRTPKGGGTREGAAALRRLAEVCAPRRSVGRVHVVHRAVHLGRVVAGGGDVGDRVVDVPGGAVDVVRLEGRVDDLQQTLGGDAGGGVGVPVVDGVGVAGGLPHDVAVEAVVGARDALGVHDVQGLLDPAVKVVGVGLGGAGAGAALTGLRSSERLAASLSARSLSAFALAAASASAFFLASASAFACLAALSDCLESSSDWVAPKEEAFQATGFTEAACWPLPSAEAPGTSANARAAAPAAAMPSGGELVDLGQTGIARDGGAHAEQNLFQSRESQWPGTVREKRRTFRSTAPCDAAIVSGCKKSCGKGVTYYPASLTRGVRSARRIDSLPAEAAPYGPLTRPLGGFVRDVRPMSGLTPGAAHAHPVCPNPYAKFAIKKNA